jgi:DNA-binding transcriptional ArsR family regulator
MRRHALSEVKRRYSLSLSELFVLWCLLDEADYETWLYTGSVTDLRDALGMGRDTISLAVGRLKGLGLVTEVRPFKKREGILYVDCFDEIAVARFHPTKPLVSDGYSVTSSATIRRPSDGLMTDSPSDGGPLSSENAAVIRGAGEKQVLEEYLFSSSWPPPRESAKEPIQHRCVDCKKVGHRSQADEECALYEEVW